MLPGSRTAALFWATTPPETTQSATAAAAAPQTITFAQIQPVLKERCVVCHSQKPTFAGFRQPPGGLLLDTPEQVKAAASRIHQQTIATQTMPIGNLTKMTDEERALLGKWLAEGAKID